MSRVAVVVIVLALGLAARPAEARLEDSPHNLSATGRGALKSPTTPDLCSFCHTPHAGRQNQALWNRAQPPVTYKLYESSTLEATLKQPTGVSRVCLSCHDGTTALSSVRVPARGAPSTIGPLKGRASLGTDLSDDHPISFVYDAALALKQGQLVDPAVLRRALPLDGTKQLQCTACHDPHGERYRKLLRIDDRAGVLCTSCHRQRNWTDSAHATSPATWRGTGKNPWPDSPWTTVADSACENCHRPHAAPHPPRLLAQAEERAVCLVCHNASVAAKNLEAEFLKPSAHPIMSTDWVHDPREDPATMARHVTCADCHEPHQTVATAAAPPAASGRLRGVRGLNIAGARVPVIAYEYEACLKCHGVRDQTTPWLTRADNTRNVRLKINPSNTSYHPVAAAGRNPTVAGFEPGYTPATVIFCTDCHDNDQWAPSGNQPRGPHGSRYAPLLARNYDTTDPSVEAYQTYASCYKCHNRDFLLGDRARTFPHRKHVVDAQAPCAVCHDAHGSRQSPGLVNFMTRDRTGKVVVAPALVSHRLELVSPGTGRGQCYLACHGKNHEGTAYP
jgi:predicted CXXCH cytochrome family protein